MKITVVHQGALGDTVLLASLFSSLRVRWPTASRTLVSRSSFGQVMMKLGVAEHAFDADDARHSAWFGPYDASSVVCGAGFSLPWANSDLVLSAVSSGHDAWAVHARQWCAHAQILFFSPRPPPDYPHHVTTFHRRQLGPLQLPPPVLADGCTQRHGPLLIGPGSGGREKCWPLENFIRVARVMCQSKIHVEFLLGEVELERFEHRDLATLEQQFVVHRNPPLVQVLDLLLSSRGYLGNDSGITHMAAWVGLPVVAIFGPSNAVQWRPVGPHVRVYQNASFHPSYGSNDQSQQVAALVLEACG